MGFPKTAVILPGSADMATANAMLLDAVNTGTLTHYGQDELTMSATMSARRRIGGDGFGFEDHDTADSTLIEACALAHWQATSAASRPPSDWAKRTAVRSGSCSTRRPRSGSAT